MSFPVLPFDARVLTIEFPQASVDGSVTEDGKVITLRADVFFAYNKATLNAKAKAALDRAAARVTELQATTVRVSGYTDSKGTAAYNSRCRSGGPRPCSRASNSAWTG
ncbi:OmpA/MotB domain protein (fragment) [Micropruina glycogenica]|uniref:OmpA/MotB domain protein n=1 Tax=Micropruina glycogenica TaxID=75385 RepID=A0A2N9JH85_9ACTN